MVTSAEATFNVSIAMQKMFSFYKRKGYNFPILYAMRKGKPINIEDCENDSVIVMDSEPMSDEYNPHKVYRSSMGFQNFGPEDERNMQKAANEIVRRHNPDAVCLIISCLYNEYDKEEGEPTDLEWEPGAFRVSQATLYIREEKEPRVLVVPYAIDPKKVDLRDESEASTLGIVEDQVKRGVSVIEFPWMIDVSKIRTIISNPYRKDA